ncbi:hypothetical protein HPULCUR_011628 [Helicostylum pulchrum]|uniref:Uncharacterized protein n=1 Tax=Helicostylum pulchrum TaxID=562976 RepID=A0ABP9YGM6_9FUNG
MNSSILSQVSRTALSAKRPAIRSFSTISAKSFYGEEPKAHHQVAPLTDSTVYTPHGEAQATTTSESTIFSPTVNHVFDD